MPHPPLSDERAANGPVSPPTRPVSTLLDTIRSTWRDHVQSTLERWPEPVDSPNGDHTPIQLTALRTLRLALEQIRPVRTLLAHASRPETPPTADRVREADCRRLVRPLAELECGAFEWQKTGDSEPFAEALRTAETILGEPSPDPTDKDEPPLLSPDAAERWIRWEQNAIARMELLEIVIRHDRTVRSALDTWTARIGQRLIDPIAGGLEKAVEDLRQLAAQDSDGSPVVPTSIEALGERIEDGTIRPILAEIWAETRAHLGTVLSGLPTTLRVQTVQPRGDSPVDPATSVIELPLFEIGRDAWGELLTEDSPVDAATFAFVEGARETLTEVGDHLAFVFQSGEPSRSAESEPPSAPTSDSAGTMVEQALRRSIDRLRELEEASTQQDPRLPDEMAATFQTARTRWRDRTLAESPTTDRLKDIEAQVSGRLRDELNSSRHHLGVLARKLHVLRRWGRRQIRRIRAGIEPFVRGDAPDAASEGTAVSEEAQRLHEQLPEVYRRLFAFEPVSDPTMLAGRQDALRSIQRALAPGEERTVPLLIVAQRGAGTTSLLNAAATGLLGADRTTLLRIAHPVRQEDELAALLSEALGFESELESLEEVATRITTAPSDALPQRPALLIDQLEHLYTRAVRGGELLLKLLKLFEETAEHLLWVGGISEMTWQVVRRQLPEAERLVRVHRLSPLSKEACEELVSLRHRRSGLDLQFDEPEFIPVTLRRMLRRASDPVARQDLLRRYWLERAAEVSWNDPTLIQLHWLKSLRLSSDGTTLRSGSFEPASFEPLRGLGRTELTVLRTLLDHRSLEVSELARLVRMPETRADLLARTLRRDGIVRDVYRDEAAEDAKPDGGRRPSEPTIEVTPFAVPAVLRLLRDHRFAYDPRG